MPIVKTEFDAYIIRYYSGAHMEASILCYKGPAYVGRCGFYKDDSPIPDNVKLNSGPYINFAISRFNDVITILREEKPLYLSFNTNNKVGGVVTDEREEVGEEES
jgi:hypothetical protein